MPAALTLIEQVSLAVFLLCMVLWVLAHRAFWLRYQQLYPERPAPTGPSLWLFKYIGGSREDHIVHTQQQDPQLERARQRLLWVWNVGGVFGLVGGCLAVALSAAHGR